MISVAEALEKVVAGMTLVGTELVPLTDGLGRVLAEDVAARLTQPWHAVSAMDGYAARAEDIATLPATLTLRGEAAAGGSFEGTVGAGECVRIFTGAPVPDGADTIVIQEDTDAKDGKVTVRPGANWLPGSKDEAGPSGKFIRPAGLDFSEGDVLLRAGSVLTARDLGLAATMNVPWLRVRRRPRVAILATGNEVVMPGDPLGPNQIISSNSVALHAYVRALGGEPVNLGIARDNKASLEACLEGALGCDVLVTIGGASVGDYDLVRKVLDEHGFRVSFHNVAMRPGKPVIFGHIAIGGGDVAVLGMPGNPVSVGVSSMVLLRPALQALQGVRDAGAAETRAALGCDLPANDKRQDYMRAALSHSDDGQLVATPYGKQDSAMMANLAHAQGLVVRPPFAPAAKAGDTVVVIPLNAGVVTV